MKIEKFALAAVAVASAAGAHSAPRQTVGYIGDPSYNVAWMIDWNAARHTARLVGYVGAPDGTWTDDGTLRVLTLARKAAVATPARATQP